MTRTAFGVMILALGILASTTAFAELRETAHGQDQASPFMLEYGRALPPIGHVGFCRRQPDECAAPDPMVHQVSLTLTELTEERRRELRLVNDLVNEMVRPVTDMALYGRIEHWTYPAGEGDCEDYVLLKRRLLMERGWPASALLITVVRDENNEGHAILTVRTDAGDMLLDNKRPNIMQWNESVYTFIKRQAHWNPREWISLAAPAPHRPNGEQVSTSK